MSVQATTQPPPPLTAPLAPLRSSGTAASTILAPASVHHHHHQPPPPPPSPLAPVTLQAPRPDAERATNEYVETPFRATTQFHHAAPTDKGTTPIDRTTASGATRPSTSAHDHRATAAPSPPAPARRPAPRHASGHQATGGVHQGTSGYRCSGRRCSE